MHDVLAAKAELGETELLDAMIVGDAGAWRLFHERYDRLIYRCITKITCKFSSVLCREDVREIYANLLYNLLRRDMLKLRSFRPEKGNKLGSWIGLLAINTAYDYLRTVSRQPRQGSINEAASTVAHQPDPYEVLLDKERRTRIDDVMKCFSERDQTFVALYYGEGLSPDEVAKEMGISVKTVYSKKHKIRSRLVDLLDLGPAPALAA
ncbi:MAG: sigma-70 family RNA polymerase sigma factor [Deltaproteobacteria bacterium]|nr:sigma-70 family RNA polymerase sigma factor [Deltaproteobacteria bacterium]